ncbi:MAG: glycosyltransferase [Oscillibacter sp.]|jgi:glycosyltransferase EpsD|nr:glycosyltransferase [Oscillibacter sp.]
MKTVLFTASTFSHIRNFHRPYLRAFHDLGWTVHIACGGETMEIPEADDAFPLPFEKKMTAQGNFQAQRILRSLMQEHHYDLVFTHTSLAAFFTRRAAAGVSPRPPIVNVAHGYLFDDQTPILKKTILLTAEKLTAPQTDLLLTMNQWDYEMAKAHHLGRRIINIPGVGVDFSRFDGVTTDDGQALRQELGFSPGDFVLVYPAEFSARKNQAMLISAMPNLPELVKLVLPGNGALIDACKAQAKSLGVQERVLFPGQRSDIPRFLRAADAAVSASRSEGLPFNIMEAMYCSLPVVASAVKGHTDLIEDGKTGLLYNYNDSAGFAHQVRHLLDEPEGAAQIGKLAHAAVWQYGLPEVLSKVMTQYLSCTR